MNELDFRRDRFGIWLANKVLRVFTSKQYREILNATYEYGLRAAARDAKEGRSLPPDWRE